VRQDIYVGKTGAQFMGRRIACTLGRGGVVAAQAKREGDEGTPRGVHWITGLLYRPDRMPKPAGWAQPIGPPDLWSDDPADPDYNHLVRAPHRFSHESLRRSDPQYDLILLTNWNWPNAEPGRGSAIFLHRWRRPGAPTAGCIGFAPADLLWIARRIAHQTRVIIR
jgi:L,D-peptidoglycan transpeptidase YkuD (ErfK/YbiS/YcfS/YnhG family)